MGEKFSSGAASEFFEFLGQLARDAQLSIWQDVDASLERFCQPIRRLEVNRRFWARSRGAQVSFAATALVRQESGDEEFLSREPGADQSRQDRLRTGTDSERQFALDAFPNQSRTGIGKSGCSGVGDQRDVFAGGEPFDELRRAHRLVVLMITDERLVYLVMLQQHSRMPRVLRGDKIDIFQNFKSAQGDVAQISNRRGDDVEHLKAWDRN